MTDKADTKRHLLYISYWASGCRLLWTPYRWILKKVSRSVEQNNSNRETEPCMKNLERKCYGKPITLSSDPNRTYNHIDPPHTSIPLIHRSPSYIDPPHTSIPFKETKSFGEINFREVKTVWYNFSNQNIILFFFWG